MLSIPLIRQPLLWNIYLSIFSSFFSLSLANPRMTMPDVICGPKDPPASNDYAYNFNEASNCVAEKSKKDSWGQCAVGDQDAKVYALAQCMGDLQPKDCSLCINFAHNYFNQCIPSPSLRIFLDGCFLRYDNYEFFDQYLEKQYDKVKCVEPKTAISDYLTNEFTKKVITVLQNITQVALSSKDGFAVGEVKGGIVGVYGLAQCWKTVSKDGCKTCLEDAGNKLKQNCLQNKVGTVLNTGCYMRYSTKLFYNDIDSQEYSSTSIFTDDYATNAVLVAGGTMLFAILSLFGAYVGYTTLHGKGRDSVHLPSSMKESRLIFKYEMLEKGTDSFHPSNKLGQGAAGSVYKATLPCGKVIAVKRLVFNTRQWVDEFFNEVNLISGINHKNIVKLLGCSLEGPESLLVYEYLANSSLDQLLFDRNKTQILTWKQRLNIIVGTAEGLAFLHGGTSTKIIHRDVKCSNILLDENLTAKIGDFGLIRCVGVDKTHLSTGVAGTLGYLAPEYLARGQLSEKSDVYSFGVLVIEIVSARKNNIFTMETDSILHSVWKHYKSNTLPECVDTRLKEDFPTIEAANVLQIALLCTQSSPGKRPSMSTVVELLKAKNMGIPSPRQPPFLNSNWLENETPMTSLVVDRHDPNASSNTEGTASPESSPGGNKLRRVEDENWQLLL